MDAEPPVDLGVVVGDVATRRDGGWLWVGRFPSGPATVRIGPAPNAVVAESWGPGSAEALAAVPGLVGLADPAARTFDPPEPLLGALLRRAPEVRVGRSTQIWPSLVKRVLEQRVTGGSAAASHLQLRRRYGDPAPGPFTDLWLSPDPERLAQESYARLHEVNLDRRRAELLIELARRARRLQTLTERPVTEALAALSSLRGLGPWTLGHVAREVWGDADAVPFGDYHLPHHVAFVLTGRRRSDDVELEHLLRPWSGHRARALRLLLTAPGPPRRTPRGDDPDIRGS